MTNPSSANSRPERNCSTCRNAFLGSARCSSSGRRRIARMRVVAAANSTSLSARTTPLLADSPSGLTTQGGAPAARRGIVFEDLIVFRYQEPSPARSNPSRGACLRLLPRLLPDETVTQAVLGGQRFNPRRPYPPPRQSHHLERGELFGRSTGCSKRTGTAGHPTGRSVRSNGSVPRIISIPMRRPASANALV